MYIVTHRSLHGNCPFIPMPRELHAATIKFNFGAVDIFAHATTGCRSYGPEVTATVPYIILNHNLTHSLPPSPMLRLKGGDQA